LRRFRLKRICDAGGAEDESEWYTVHHANGFITNTNIVGGA